MSVCRFFTSLETARASVASGGRIAHGRSSSFSDHSGRGVLHVFVAHHVLGELGLGFLKAGARVSVKPMNLLFRNKYKTKIKRVQN